MDKSHEIEQALRKVHNQPTFISELLSGALQWPVPQGIDTLDDLGYEWSKADLLSQDLEKRVVDGKAFQIRLTDNQTWGIFVLEFRNPDALTVGRGITGALRKVLRGLVASRSHRADLPAFQRANLLFICTHGYKHYRFAYFKAPPEGTKTAPLATFGWSPDEPARTACEFNLPDLTWPGNAGTSAEWTARWARAFDVEKVTRVFFEQYRDVFKKVEGAIDGISDKGRLRLFTQQLFNRLMFIAFIQKKDWLKIEGTEPSGYLTGLWKHYLNRKSKSDGNFYRDRLRMLFFNALNNSGDINLVDLNAGGAFGGPNVTQTLVGNVPYLNGGLFEKADDKLDDDLSVIVPDAAIDAILHQLFARFNFTVVESTPLDIEVAVDPEMLGKVFEELVTGRHESGSYYTPKPIVSFMCREAIKGYLQTQLPKESASAIAALVDHQNPAELSNGEGVLDALRKVRVCDPACGSGAYLLGMMHELLDLRARLFASNIKLDAKSVYDRKLEVIQTNVYGVDIDPFAVNVARLRLWLSLAVDYDGPTPPPLPNLDFKIESGDSLAAPDPSGGGQLLLHRAQIEELLVKKRDFLCSHSARKQELRSEINALRKELKKWSKAQGGPQVFDWAVEFAEVFVGEAFEKTMDGQFGFAADSGKQLGFKVAEQDKPGGFDIVLANPPYVRQELLGKEYKEGTLKPVFPEVYSGTADLYCYFYARAIQLLRQGGMLAFISSNKWFRAGYGKKLRSLMAKATSVRTILDFHALPVFESAIAYPMIFVAGKGPSGSGQTPTLVEPPTLGPPYPNITEVVTKFGQQLPKAAIGIDGSWHLASSATADYLAIMRASGPPLIEYVGGEIYRGVMTGLNDAFVIDGITRARLIEADKRSAELIKPMVAGKDVKRWRIAARDCWLIFVPWETHIDQYPAIEKHLTAFQSALMARPDVRDGRHNWWCLSRYGAEHVKAFDRGKIVYQEIATYQGFAWGKPGLFVNNKVFFIASEDTYLLAVLNSKACWSFLDKVAAKLVAGAFALQLPYVSQIPIPTASPADRTAIAALAQKCLDAGGIGCEAWEKEIDERVAALYGL